MACDFHRDPHHRTGADSHMGRLVIPLHDPRRRDEQRDPPDDRGGLALPDGRPVGRSRSCAGDERQEAKGTGGRLEGAVQARNREDRPPDRRGGGRDQKRAVHLRALRVLRGGGHFLAHGHQGIHGRGRAPRVSARRLDHSRGRGHDGPLRGQQNRGARAGHHGIAGQGVLGLHVCVQLHRHLVVHGVLQLEHRHFLVAAHRRVRDVPLPRRRPPQPEENPAVGAAPRAVPGPAGRVMEEVGRGGDRPRRHRRGGRRRCEAAVRRHRDPWEPRGE
mmetsp:Transcript_82712/g.252798  ORF Transcript_82712/g.252798 Transcript_82712/m.252798 type:complete len:275 (-) Transcript_82712:1763-2587(-)